MGWLGMLSLLRFNYAGSHTGVESFCYSSSSEQVFSADFLVPFLQNQKCLYASSILFKRLSA